MIHTNGKELTEDAKAILLLCGRFGKPADTGQAKPLSLGEYNRLADWMVGQKLRPADLLRDAIWETAPGVDTGIDADRIRRVLSRGAAMALAVEKWTQHGIWIICRSDPHYPERLKKHLKKQAPPVLFGVGDTRLLNGGGLAVVGSRNVDAAGEAFTRAVAEECAGSGIPIVSGGARGVDQMAMLTALNAGGRVVGVLADGLQKAAVAGKYRTGIRENRLVLISPFHPESRFNVGNAMGRNKYIYALSDYALVISAEIEKGGTWAGATEEMKRSNGRPVFVRHENGIPEGNPELIRRGAIPFPRPPWEDRLDRLLHNRIFEKKPNGVQQIALFG
jgi:predicted Rossmann fold nucleotide-binding protein DprA/Smf involved in DNA uptake